MPKLRNLVGQQFGRLTVIKKSEKKDNKRVYWDCICECGNKTIVPTSNLTRGHTKSCGCLNADHSLKHGMARQHKPSRLYWVWVNMRARCRNKNNPSYKYYGGKGISVCEEWDDFSAFETWAIENGYDENAEYGECSIDRVDVNGDYEPKNCRWITMKEQQRNKQNTRKLTYNEDTKPLTEWVEIFGLDVNIVGQRWGNKSLTPEEILFGQHDAITI